MYIFKTFKMLMDVKALDTNLTSQHLTYNYFFFDQSMKISTFVHSLFHLQIFFFPMSISYFNDFTLFYRRGSKWD